MVDRLRASKGVGTDGLTCRVGTAFAHCSVSTGTTSSDVTFSPLPTPPPPAALLPLPLSPLKSPLGAGMVRFRWLPDFVAPEVLGHAALGAAKGVAMGAFEGASEGALEGAFRV